MSFSVEEKAVMLELKWVGSTVITRLEQMGFSSLEQLAQEDCQSLVTQIAAMQGSNCWKNSPAAKSAIQGIIDLAKQRANK